MQLLQVQKSHGCCAGTGGVQGLPRLCGWGDRDTVAGLPVPPSGGQGRLRGHPSPGPGWQQTFPSQDRPACFQQPPQSHAWDLTQHHVLPAPLPPFLILGPGGCLKHCHGRDRGIDCSVHPARGEHRETWSEIQNFCP